MIKLIFKFNKIQTTQMSEISDRLNLFNIKLNHWS